MKCASLVLAAILVVPSGLALADGGGSFTVKGTTYPLKSAYAYSAPDPFDHSKQSTVIVFSERVIDVKKVGAGSDPLDALDHAVQDRSGDEKRPNRVEVMIARDDPKSPVQQIGYQTDQVTSSASVGSGRYQLVLKKNDAGRIEGTLRTTNAKDKTSEFGAYVDLHFALDLTLPASDK
ncbi:MAG: hypothetical protein ABIT01_10405 [Thermoanaerobaculia bacterium]